MKTFSHLVEIEYKNHFDKWIKNLYPLAGDWEGKPTNFKKKA